VNLDLFGITLQEAAPALVVVGMLVIIVIGFFLRECRVADNEIIRGTPTLIECVHYYPPDSKHELGDIYGVVKDQDEYEVKLNWFKAICDGKDQIHKAEIKKFREEAKKCGIHWKIEWTVRPEDIQYVDM